MSETSFYVPTRPYSFVDALNRRAAATGSAGYARMASHADYNGHRVRVTWNVFRGYYIAEYQWAGRNVLARGTFTECLNAALREYDRGALGASVSVTIPSNKTDDVAAAQNHPRLNPSSVSEEPWYTWRHSVAASCARDTANPGMVFRIFDFDLLSDAGSEAEYDAALKAKYGRIYN